MKAFKGLLVSLFGWVSLIIISYSNFSLNSHDLFKPVGFIELSKLACKLF
jgi:hypothetical protein